MVRAVCLACSSLWVTITMVRPSSRFSLWRRSITSAPIFESRLPVGSSARIISGLLDTPTSGTIEINGTRTESMGDKELAAFRNKTLGFVFQSFHLINSLNVIDNVELPLLYRKMSSSERTALAKQVLERVGLSHRMKHMPTQLSGGQCQRVAIARAIVGNPEIILADEPTGNLDSKMGAEVMELLHKLNKEDGRTIVMVTHNEAQAKQTDRTIRFFDGRQVE